jgi:NAD(P)-dependent dehydrogenase (short-subunit alcohol dehydrogenase family)
VNQWSVHGWRMSNAIAMFNAKKLIAERDARAQLGKMGEVWDVARTVLFLALDEAKYIIAT